MRSSKRFAAIVAVMLMAWLASAADSAAYVSGKTFLADCLRPADAVQRAECRGYILAIADAINSNVAKGQRVCLPESADQDDVREDVMRWVRENARGVQRRRGFGIVYAALIKTYPCRK